MLQEFNIELKLRELFATQKVLELCDQMYQGKVLQQVAEFYPPKSALSPFLYPKVNYC